MSTRSLGSDAYDLPIETMNVLNALSQLNDKSNLSEEKVKTIMKDNFPELQEKRIPELLKASASHISRAKLNNSTIMDKLIHGAINAVTYLENQKKIKSNEKKELNEIHKILNSKYADLEFLKKQQETSSKTIKELLGPHAETDNGELYLYLFLQTEGIPRDNFNQLKAFVDECLKTKKENLVLLEQNDGSIGKQNPKCFELYTELSLKVTMAEAMRKSDASQEVPGKAEIQELLQTLLQSALLDDIQVETDSFAFALPGIYRPDAPEDRVHSRLVTKVNTYIRHKNEILHNKNLSVKEKSTLLAKLQFENDYEKADRMLFYQMEKWEQAVDTKEIPFEFGIRKIGYMTPDKLRKNEDCEVVLDLSDMKITYPKQCTKAFTIINMCTLEGKKRPELFKNWFAIKNKQPPPTLQAILKLFKDINILDTEFIDEVNKLSNGPEDEKLTQEQIRVLLEIALNYSYQILHGTRYAFMKLTQQD